MNFVKEQIEVENLLLDLEKTGLYQEITDYNDEDSVKEFAEHNKKIIVKYQLPAKDYNNPAIIDAENFKFSSPYVVEIVKEDANNIISSILDKIRNIINSVISNFKILFTKFMTMYPMLENSISNLIEVVEKLNKTKPFSLENRRNLKWVINKAPCIFLLTNDMSKIEGMLQPSVNINIFNGFVDRAISYGNCLLDNPDINPTGFINRISKETQNILSGVDVNNPYSQLVTKLKDAASLEGGKYVFRADDHTCKIRQYVSNVSESGVPVIKTFTKSIHIDNSVEENIIITKIYSPGEIVRLLRKDLLYISSIRETSSSMKSRLEYLKKCTDNISNKHSSHPVVSPGYRVGIQNYFKMVNFITTTLPGDILLGQYNTAKNIYRACLKLTELGFGTTSVSNESLAQNMGKPLNLTFDRSLSLTFGICRTSDMVSANTVRLSNDTFLLGDDIGNGFLDTLRNNPDKYKSVTKGDSKDIVKLMYKNYIQTEKKILDNIKDNLSNKETDLDEYIIHVNTDTPWVIRKDDIEKLVPNLNTIKGNLTTYDDEIILAHINNIINYIRYKNNEIANIILEKCKNVDVATENMNTVGVEIPDVEPLNMLSTENLDTQEIITNTYIPLPSYLNTGMEKCSLLDFISKLHIIYKNSLIGLLMNNPESDISSECLLTALDNTNILIPRDDNDLNNKLMEINKLGHDIEFISNSIEININDNGYSTGDNYTINISNIKNITPEDIFKIANFDYENEAYNRVLVKAVIDNITNYVKYVNGLINKIKSDIINNK